MHINLHEIITYENPVIRRWRNKLSSLSIALLFSVLSVFGEGSKDVWILNYSTGLFFCSDFENQCNSGSGARTQFAVYGCDSIERLYFEVDSTVEKVYLGFQGVDPSSWGTTRKIVYRIKNMSGSIVKSEADLPTSGTGYINNITEARNGPQQLGNSSGYDAIVWDPPANGTYYIEFQRMKQDGISWSVNPGTFRIDLFDITVADTAALEEKEGRVYSSAWQFNSYSGYGMNNCSATFYVYSADSIITSLTLDDLQGGVWYLYCNQTGVGTSGDWITDRQSINGSAYNPQYRIFLNEPDTNIFPPASTLGSVVGTPWGQAYCDNGTIDFHVTVDKAGNVDINLDFDDPYADRTISAIVSAGENIITWDGNDANGTPVPNNVNVEFTISYINGLTNLPLYDVESNNNGFTIDIVAPSGAAPLVYWDDTQVGGNSNFTGCSGSGCHPWADGDLITMNTWWYNVSTTTAPVTIVEERGPDTLVFDQSPPQNYCAGETGVTFSVASDPNTERYYWSYTGTGATIHQADTSDNFITVDFSPSATAGNIEVYGTNNNCSNPGPTSSLAISIVPLPNTSITITPNDTVCIDSQTTFAGTDNAGTNVTSWEWDFGDGNTATGQTANHTYSAVLIDSVRLIATNNNGCVDTTYREIWVTDPVINMNISPQPACLTDTVTFSGVGGPITYTDWIWDFGDGSNADTGEIVNHHYSASGTYSITLHVCSKTASDQLIVHQPAVADAGSDETLCQSHPFDFSTSSVLPSASDYDSLLWIGGAGSFSDPHTLLPVYTPAPNETGTVPLSLIAYGMLPCGNDTSTMILTLDSLPLPGYFYLPSDSICVSELISFTDTSGTNITNWLWDFGDGNSASAQNPTHFYNTDGTYNVKLVVSNNYGCSDSVTKSLQVHPLPQPDFGITPNDTICAELPLSFTGSDNAGTTITQWQWDFGDGNTGTGQSVMHTYTTAGDYTVTLSVLNNNSCSETVSKQVHIHSLPQADFTISPNDTSCMGEVVSFDANPITSDIVNWQWQFGDGNNASGQNVTHTFNSAGTFNILSIYTNNNGCLDTTIHSRVVQNVYVNFNMVPDPTCENYVVNFTGTGDLVTFTPWNWNFGDGTPGANGHNVSHVYTSEDTVTVSLDVCSQHVEQSLTVKGACSVNAGSDTVTCQDVYFDLSTLRIPPSAVNYDSVRWYGGLGTFDDPTKIAPVYTPHPSEGAIQNDTITLTMVGYGYAPCENDTSSMQLVVIPGAYAQAGTDENSCFNEPYDFHNSQLVPFATNYVNLYWTTSGTGHFVDPHVEVPVYIPGNGELGPVTMTLVATNVINCDSIDEMVLTIRPTYDVPQYYTVCHYDSVYAQGEWRYVSGTYYDTLQTIYDCDSVIITNLTVRDKIDRDFVISSGDSVCRLETVSFNETGTANLTSRLWVFGDGTTSTQESPQHQYDTTGIFNVIFYYTDVNGCSDSAVHQIHVFPLPDVSMSINLSSNCVNTQVDFSGFSNANIVSWDWDYGDGTSGIGQNTSHVYTTWGLMPVTLDVLDDAGCSQSTTQFVSIAQPPIADFSYSVILCDTIQFTDASTCAPGYNLVLWHWDFGDGDTSDIQNPVHVYDTGGIYNVTLLVTADSLGYMCTDTVTKQVSVPLTPDIFYTWTPAPTCFGDSTTFHGTSGFPISTWHWDFDDGYFGTDSIVNHMYSDTGYYNVLLTITDTNGCINSLSHVVEVVPLPDLSMTLSDTVLCSGGEVICSGSSSDSITSWYWDFGDGSFSVNQNTTHYYGNGGTYQISLTATDTSGCSTTIIKSVIVSPSPVAGYSYSVISCTQLSFTDLSTAPSGYNIVGWNWDFDDGTTSTLQNPVHDFPSSGGLYNVRLVVTSDSSGYSCSDTITQGVIVPEQPSLFFTWDPEPTMLGNSTSFYGTSGNTITSWDWDFGDGTFSTLQNPTHTYGFVGTFTVTLTVTDDSGCSNSVSHDVTVVNVPGLDFTWGTSCEGSPTQFYIDQSVTNVNAVVSWFWDFGDGGTSVDMEPQHTYMTSGTYDVSLTIVDTMNATNTVLHVVTVHPLPVVNFGYEQPVCQGNYTQFHDYSSSPSGYITQWIWDFGDGSDTTVYFPGNPDVTHLYTSSGTYTVTLTVLNSDSCSNSNINDITIQPSPVALFTHSNGNCSSQPVQFTDQSNSNGGGAIVGWLWNFGDPSSGSSNTSTLQNPSHLFSSPGTYTVLLSIENVNGCVDTTSETLTINDNPGVDFSYTTACLGQETHFYVDTTVTNVQEVALYAWDFGDGGTSNLPNPTHVYGTQGIYNVTLTITTNDGCTAVAQHMVPIKPLPTANFASTSPVCYGDTVYFTNLSSSPNGLISRWDWDFGDGTTVTINYPDDPDVSHYYSNSTTFAVVLTVTDTSGCVNSVTKLIEVVANPIADFSYEESCYGEPVFFTDLSSSNAGPDLSTWDWYFGDPNSGTSNHSTLQNPTHVYTEPGTYTTTLIISNTLGCSDTTTQDIIVDTLPYVAISIEDDSICLNEPAVFTGIGTDINSWYWQFGDGGTSIEQNPTYQYSSPGTYVVTLTVTGIDGCENSTTDTIHVNDTPDADFTYENTCINDSTYFVDASSSSNGYITSWSWDFGDGGSSTEPNPVHLYASRDSYQVVLVVTDNFGCSDTVSRWVEVYDRPHPGFSYNQVCEPAGQVYFFDESEPGEDGSPIEEWNWNLYDGYYSSEINPSYIYPRTDTCYNVTLTVTDANGCSSSDTVEVCLFGTITADFSSTEECEGQLTLFTASYSPYSDSVISYTWDFHDGTPLDSTYHDTISHLFPSAGTYLVELTVKDTNGCNYHAYNEVVVDSLPVPRFSYTAGFCDEPTIFTDESFGGGTFIQSWYWDFGDINSGSANYSTEQNPSHYYGPLDSTYIVKLVVTNFNGCSDSIEQAVEISPCLESGFSMIDSIVPCSGKVVLFNDTSRISSNNGDITGWYWDFGDGNTISYSSYEPVVEHIYVNPGVYEVTLVITADIGGNVYSDTTGMSIEVYPTPESGISVANSCYGDSTYFYYAGSGNGEPVSYWHWDFDTTSLSGDTSNIKDAVYKYPAYGSYISSLSVWNKYGCSDTAYKEVTIYKPPVADFEYEATCMSYYTYFSDNTRADSSAIEYWRWDFDTTSANPPFSYDDTSNLQNPQYIYDSSGHYVVELITVDGHQCRDTVMKEIEIYPKPTAAFNLIDEYNNEQGQIYLENLSKNAIEYVWDFGNGIVSNETNPVYQYDEDGKYDIMLIAYNSYRCPDTAVTVYDLMFTKLYVPNAFVPSSENPEIKVFKPKGTNLRRYTLEIYSGWGNLLFKSSKLEDGTPAEGWDGTYNGQDMPTGTYIWHIRAEFKDGTYWRGSDNGDGNINTSGTLTLIR